MPTIDVNPAPRTSESLAAAPTRAGADAVLAAFVMVFACLVALTTVTNYDIWFHLAMGREIVVRGIPTVDPFTYTQLTSPADLMSWLSDVIFYGVERLGGVPALSLLKAAFSVALVVVLWQTSGARKSGAPHAPAVGALLIVIALFALKFRFFVRPHLFELVLLPIAVHLLVRYRWRPRMMLGLCLLQVLWTNLHGSFLVGLALPWVVFGSDVARGLVTRDLPGRREVTGFVATFGALLLATMVNPRGPGVYGDPAQLARWGSEMATLGEFQPLTLATLTGFSAQYTWGFSALTVLGVSAFLVLVGKKTPPGWTDSTLLTAFLLLPILGGVRFIAEFVVVATPILIRWWVRALPASTPVKVHAWSKWGLSGALIPAWWALVPSSAVYEFGLGEKRGKFPSGAVQFLEETQPTGNVFNSIGFGGYLMWHAPATKVFIDGRVPIYPRDFYRRYLDAHTDARAWAAIEEEFSPQVAVLEYLTDLVGKERMPVIEASDEWALVYWDPVAKVYVKRGGANADIIASNEIRWARPAYHRTGGLREILARPDAVARAASEYGRLLAAYPDNDEAAVGLAYLLAFGSDPDWPSAVDVIETRAERWPQTAIAQIVECRAAIGVASFSVPEKCDRLETLVAFEVATEEVRRATMAARVQAIRSLDEAAVALSLEGRSREALVKFDSAMALDPSNPIVYVNRGLMHEREDKLELALEDFHRARQLAPAGWTHAGSLDRLIGDVEAALGRPR